MNAALKDAVGSYKQRDWPKHFFVIFFLIIELFPLYMMLQISFKDNDSFSQNPWVPQPPYSVTETHIDGTGDETHILRTATWTEVFSGVEAAPGVTTFVSGETDFDLSVYRIGNWAEGLKTILPAISNSLFVAVTGTFLSMCFAVFGAYFFARYKMPFGGVIWGAFMLLMLLPGVANIVPLFTLLKDMHLLNTLYAIIIVGVASAQVFNIFVLRNFIEDLPKDLFEAAEMDGATHLQQIRTVVIPLSMPIIGTLSILAFLAQWNEFLLPLIVLRDGDLFTIGVRLIYLDGEYVKQWGPIMAAYFIASIPLIVIFLFCMRLFVRGLSAGAVKG